MAIAFVQTANSGSPSGTATTKTATFAGAQTAGNLNVVVINFGKAGANPIGQTVSSVTDSKGNTYTAATSLAQFVSPGADSDGCQIWYCSNIAVATAGSNVVTATLSGASSFFAIAVLEYSGCATTSAVDVTHSAFANGTATTSANSGAVTTTNANDLLIGGFCLFDGNSGTSSGATIRSAFYTMFVDELIVTVTGSNTASANSAGTAGWVAQMVAFKAAGGGTPVLMTGSCQGRAANSGNLKATKALSGSNLGHAANSGTLQKTLSGSNLGHSANSGILTNIRSKPVLIQGKRTSSTTNAFTTINSAHSTLVVTVGISNFATSINTPTDSAGNTYVAVGSPVALSGAGVIQHFVCKDCVGGTTLNTVTCSPVTQLWIAEFAGVDNNTPVLQSNTNSGTSTSVTSGSVTLTNQFSSLVWAAMCGSTSTAGDAAWTAKNDLTGGEIYQVRGVTTTGTFSATGTQTSSSPFVAAIFGLQSSLKPLSGTNLGHAANSGTLTLATPVALAGSCLGHAANSGKLQKTLSGTNQGRAANSGSLTVTKLMSGNALGHAANSGSLQKTLAGTNQGQARNSGQLSVQWQFKQVVNGHNNTGTTATITLANTTTGNTLFVVGMADAIVSITGITASTGTAVFSLVRASSSNVSSPVSTEIWQASNITGGAAPLITITYSGATGGCDVTALEFSGGDRLGSIDTTAAVAGTAVSQTLSLTTTSTVDLGLYASSTNGSYQFNSPGLVPFTTFKTADNNLVFWRPITTTGVTSVTFGKSPDDAAGVAGALKGVQLVINALSGANQGRSANSGTLLVKKPLAGSSIGQARNSGILTSHINNLATPPIEYAYQVIYWDGVPVGTWEAITATGYAANSGTLQVIPVQPAVHLSGSCQGRAQNTGKISLGKPLSGANQGRAANSGLLTVGRALSGSCQGRARNFGSMGSSRPMAGSCQGRGRNSGVLTVIKPTILMGGVCTGRGQNIGVLTISNFLQGACIGQAANSGEITSEKMLLGFCLGHAVNSGTLSTGAYLAPGPDMIWSILPNQTLWTLDDAPTVAVTIDPNT